ncbi:MAG TPA: hypothetical protein VFS83_15665 [Ktedonobacterales bacterium]|nr:hypothetical protein [Ktedonobacterales bacterium]
MSAAYDQRQRYQLYLAPDQGPIIEVKIDGQRVSAARMMSDESAVDEIIRQIRNESHSRDQTSGLHFDDPRARGSLKNILPHMHVIHNIAGMVVYIPGSAPGNTAGGSQKSGGPGPEEMQKVENTWRKNMEALKQEHERDIKYLQRNHEEALEAARRQAQMQLDNARNRIYSLETERDQALKQATELRTERDIAQAAGHQGSEEVKAEISRLNGVVTEQERVIAQARADLEAATQREEEARGKERRSREEAQMLHKKIEYMKQEDQKRRVSNMQALAKGFPSDDFSL